MIRFLLLVILLMLVARAFWRIVDGLMEGATGQPSKRRVRAGTKLVRDPVCGTFIVPTASLSVTSDGATHYFCSEACRVKYERRA